MCRLCQYSHVSELPYEKIEMHEARIGVNVVKYKLKKTDTQSGAWKVTLPYKVSACAAGNCMCFTFWDAAGNCMCFHLVTSHDFVPWNFVCFQNLEQNILDSEVSVAKARKVTAGSWKETLAPITGGCQLSGWMLGGCYERPFLKRGGRLHHQALVLTLLNPFPTTVLTPSLPQKAEWMRFSRIKVLLARCMS